MRVRGKRGKNPLGQCFGSGFFWDPDRTFFLSPDPYRQKIRIQIHKRPKTVNTSSLFYFIFSTLNTVFFGQVPPKPNQKHHLDPISLLMDGSGS